MLPTRDIGRLLAAAAVCLPAAFSPAQAADDDIVVRLEVFRSGLNDHDSVWPNVREFHEYKKWDFGPLLIETRFPAERTIPRPAGQQRLLDILENWHEPIDGYLDRFNRPAPEPVNPFAPAPVIPGSAPAPVMPDIPDVPAIPGSFDPAALHAYYVAIRPEVERILNEARDMQDDIEFLRQLLSGIRFYRSTSGDERLPSDTVISLEAGTVHSDGEGIEYSYMGRDRRVTTKHDWTEEVTPWSTAQWPEKRFPSEIYLGVWQLEDSDLEKLRDLLDGIEDRKTDLTIDAAALELTPKQRQRFEEVTLPYVHLVFRDAYEQALREAVRYLWFMSPVQFPLDLADTRANDSSPPETWHDVTIIQEGGNRWVDSNGAPVLRTDAQLRLPPVEGPVFAWAAFPLHGHIERNDPRDISGRHKWGGWFSNAISDRSLEAEPGEGMRHRLVTRYEVIGTARNTTIPQIGFSNREPNMMAEALGLTMLPSHNGWHFGGIRHVFGDEVEGGQSYQEDSNFFRRLTFHQVTAAGEDLNAQGKFIVEYTGTRLPEEGKNDQITLRGQDRYEVTFMLGDGETPFRTRRAPGASRSAIP